LREKKGTTKKTRGRERRKATQDSRRLSMMGNTAEVLFGGEVEVGERNPFRV